MDYKSKNKKSFAKVKKTDKNSVRTLSVKHPPTKVIPATSIVSKSGFGKGSWNHILDDTLTDLAERNISISKRDKNQKNIKHLSQLPDSDSKGVENTAKQVQQMMCDHRMEVKSKAEALEAISKFSL